MPKFPLLCAAATAGALFAFAGTAMAGGCPAGHVVADGQGQKPGATMPRDVTDVVLGSIDLATQPAAIDDRRFRMRRLAIKLGGEVPWHSHDDGPALIAVAVGEVTEHASSCRRRALVTVREGKPVSTPHEERLSDAQCG